MHNLWQLWVNGFSWAVVLWSMIANGKRPCNGLKRRQLSPSHPEICDAILARVIARAWTRIAARVPVGYEDKTGFHLVMEFPLR
jgi:hypothetical protein